MLLLHLKLLSIPLILIINLVCGIIPYWCVRKRQRVARNDYGRQNSGMIRFLSLANCFSSGVFLATCFIGLFPSVDMKFRQIFIQMKSDVDYPIAEVSLCFGFFLVWFLEISINSCVKCMPCGSSAVHHHSHSVSNDNHELEGNLLNSEENGEESWNEHRSQGEISHHSAHNHSHNAPGDSLLKSILLTVALGFHSTLEGIAYGLLDTNGQVISMLIAILIHESLCCFSLGINLSSRNERPLTAIILLGTFSSLIPIGIAIGLGVQTESDSIGGQLFSAIMQGIVSGTFIYVIFCEILPHEISGKFDRFLKLLFSIIGFVAIALIRLIQHKTRKPRSFGHP